MKGVSLRRWLFLAPLLLLFWPASTATPHGFQGGIESPGSRFLQSAVAIALPTLLRSRPTDPPQVSALPHTEFSCSTQASGPSVPQAARCSVFSDSSVSRCSAACTAAQFCSVFTSSVENGAGECSIFQHISGRCSVLIAKHLPASSFSTCSVFNYSTTNSMRCSIMQAPWKEVPFCSTENGKGFGLGQCSAWGGTGSHSECSVRKASWMGKSCSVRNSEPGSAIKRCSAYGYGTFCSVGPAVGTCTAMNGAPAHRCSTQIVPGGSCSVLGGASGSFCQVFP